MQSRIGFLNHFRVNIVKKDLVVNYLTPKMTIAININETLHSICKRIQIAFSNYRFYIDVAN